MNADNLIMIENTDTQKPLLYKYLDIDGAAGMLHNSNIQFTNATRLNDPFDCHPGLIDFSNVPSQYRMVLPWSGEAVDMYSTRHINYRERAWICCLSKVNDSILMWSYYNQHKGVCVGLDMEKVKGYLHCWYGMMVFNSPFEVQYRDIIDRPSYSSNNQDFFWYQLTTKAKDWSHEQEMRMFILDPSNMFFNMALPYEPEDANEVIDWKEVRSYPKIGGECFASIYLGVKIDEKKKKGIIKLARKLNPNITIYQMQVNPDAFKLDYIEID